MNVEEISKIIEVFAKSGLQEFSYEEGDVKLSLQGKQNAPAVSAAPVVMTAAPAPVQNPVPAPAAETAPAAEEKEGLIITSPLVGVFYAAPSEEAEPYVTVGSTVQKGQIVAIVEAMKLMNEIESDYSGTVAEILVENGQAVEYGQPLFRIVP